MAKRSKRLESIASMVSQGLPFADVGCDHAHLAMELVASGKTPAAIAVDVNEGPLSIAEANIAQAGLEDRIETRLSDGFAAIRPGEVRSAVIAGMGGQLMWRIISEGREVVAQLHELILAPQSDAELIRRRVSTLGFMITLEDIVFEDGQFYPIIRMAPGMQLPLTRLELLFGPQLLTRQHPVLHDYLVYRRGICRGILEEMRSAEGMTDPERMGEIESDLMHINEALRFFV